MYDCKRISEVKTKMSRKIQVVIEDPIAEEVDAVVVKKRFGNQSEFIRHLIREYLNDNAPTGPRTEIMDLFTSNLENQFASV